MADETPTAQGEQLPPDKAAVASSTNGEQPAITTESLSEVAAAEAPAPQPEAAARRRRGRLAEEYATRNLTEGSISKNLLFLSWPQMTEGALLVLYQMSDLFWAGQGFGLQALAGVGAVWTFTTLMLTARGGLDTAMRAMVARAVGAGDLALANRVVIQAFALNTVVSLFTCVIPGMLFPDQLLALIGLPEDVRSEVVMYMRFQCLNQALVAWRTMSAEALQSAGDSLTPLRATFITRVVHMVLSPTLAFGLLFFPEMGLMGLAVSGATGQLVGAVQQWHSLFSGKSRLHITLRGYKVDWELTRRLVRIGIPASVTSMERALSQFVMIGIVASFGVTTLGIYTLSQRTDMLANRVIVGLANASGVLVGQNLGAGQPQRARQTVRLAMLWAFGSQVVFSALLALFPVAYMSIFSSDADMHELGTTWFRILALGYVTMGLSTVLMQCFNTAGDTMIPAAVNIVTIWLVQLPLALLLRDVFDVGSTAVAWAIVAAMLFRLAIYAPYFVSGRWLRAKVLT
jgi:putative MATE family efflux protein